MVARPQPVPEVPPTPLRGDAFAAGDWVLFGAVSLIWGASFLFIAVGLESLEPGVITLGRVGLGAAILHVLPGSSMRLDGEDRGRMVLLSVLWVGIPFTLFPIAEQHINSAVTGLLNGATPTFTALFAWVLFRQRTSGGQLVGVVLGLAGIALISAPSLGEGSSAAGGVGLVLLATLCYGIAGNLAVPLQQRYGSLGVMARMLALGTVWTLPYGIYGAPDSEVELWPVAAVAVLGLLGTGIAFLIMGRLVASVGATRASFITYLVPVVSLALGVTVEGDHVELLALGGVVLVIAGAVLAGRREA